MTRKTIILLYNTACVITAISIGLTTGQAIASLGAPRPWPWIVSALATFISVRVIDQLALKLTARLRNRTDRTP